MSPTSLRPRSLPAVLMLVFALVAVVPLVAGAASAGCSAHARPTVSAVDTASEGDALADVASVTDALGWILPTMRAIVPALGLDTDAQALVFASTNEAIEINRDLQAAVATAQRARDRGWDRCDTHAILARLGDHLGVLLTRDLTHAGYSPPREAELALLALRGIEGGTVGRDCPTADGGASSTLRLERSSLRATPLRVFPPLTPRVYD